VKGAAAAVDAAYRQLLGGLAALGVQLGPETVR
jgi:hypothetical protein